ncbi:MAG TPA: DUF3574 domain-containing protein [Burkholderiales bacterium]|nr:DUF3574 domain-containing protein [Burkholderiales bacterium]
MSRTAFHALTKHAALLALALVCAPVPDASADELGDLRRIVEELRHRDERCRGPLAGDAFARTELFFGLSRPDGVISEEEFQGFVNNFVTPRFPDGLTLLGGAGQFRDASGTIISEGSKLLILLYPARTRDANDLIEAIRFDYKTQFQQQSVLRADDRSCVSF